MKKLSILIECDEEKKTASIIKLDTEERNQRRLEYYNSNKRSSSLKELFESLGLPNVEENSSTQHMLIFNDEKKAKDVFDLLIQYSVNPYIYKLCYGEMSFEEIENKLKR